MPTFETTIPFPVSGIDLEDWLYNMSDEDYQKTARQHRALGVFKEDSVRGMINVEVAGHALLVQHYHEVKSSREAVELYSTKSRAYLFHIYPVTVQVTWRMTVKALDEKRTTFSCTVEPEMPSIIYILAIATGVIAAIRRHTKEETIGFAADITRKLKARESAGVQ
jgi:hypothetical protein